MADFDEVERLSESSSEDEEEMETSEDDQRDAEEGEFEVLVVPIGYFRGGKNFKSLKLSDTFALPFRAALGRPIGQLGCKHREDCSSDIVECLLGGDAEYSFLPYIMSCRDCVEEVAYAYEPLLVDYEGKRCWRLTKAGMQFHEFEHVFKH